MARLRISSLLHVAAVAVVLISEKVYGILPPSDVTVVRVEPDSVKVAWNHPEGLKIIPNFQENTDYEIYYYAQRTPGKNQFTAIRLFSPIGATSWSESGFSPYKKYMFRVRARYLGKEIGAWSGQIDLNPSLPIPVEWL